MGVLVPFPGGQGTAIQMEVSTAHRDTHTHHHKHTPADAHTGAHSGSEVSQVLTRWKGTEPLTWHEADLPCLWSSGLEIHSILYDLWQVEHGHLQTRVLPGQLVGQGACAAWG